MTALKEETPTPRTNAEATRKLLNVGYTTTRYEVVPASFARTLERELLAQAREVGRLREDAAAVREAVLRETWSTVNKWIVPGDLPGNGCDKTAQRNGMILASNIIMEMIAADTKESGSG